MTIGWGIVGIGTHADHCMAPAITQAKDAGLIAVCSRDARRAAAFAAKHGVGRSYDDFSAMLRDGAVDAVYISTPNNLHAAQTIEAAQAGKHVLCEKPMAISVIDSERMIESCQKNGVKLGIAFQNRHHPAHVEAKRLIAGGTVGNILMGMAEYSHFLGAKPRSVWRRDPMMAGAGTLMGMAVHALDLLRFLVGREVDMVQAITDERPPDRPLDETVVALLRFQGGAYGTVVSSRHFPHPANDVVIYGSKARIRGSGTVGMRLVGVLEIVGDSPPSTSEFPCNDPVTGTYLLQVESFNRSIRENTEPNASGYDGLEMARIVEAILDSNRQGKAVRIQR